MKPLLKPVALFCLLLAVNAHPENIEDVKHLPQHKEPLIEAEESEPQARIERCTTCSGNLNIKSPNAILAALQALPGAEVHTQQSFEECTSAKGCAGIKVKDGRVLERFGDLDEFKAAAANNNGNDFTFHAVGSFGSNFAADGKPFWWMNQDSPFKNVGEGNFEKFSKSSSSSFSSNGGAAGAGGGLDLAANPFLNGEFSKGNGAFAGQSESGKPNTFQQSAFESSSFSSSGKGEVDISKNPFLNGGFQAGQAGQAGQNSQSAFQAGQSQSGFQAGQGQAGFQAQNGYNSNGAANGFAGQGQTGQSSFSSNKFSTNGYTGSSPSPFTASAGASNVNLIQNNQKASEFDFESQQQSQQNIDEAFQSGGSGSRQEQNGGELHQTCAGQGYVCVHKAQCNNGIVSSNGATILQARTKKQYCNLKNEICCRIEISTIPGAGGLQGSLGVGGATYSGSGSQESGIFGSSSNQNGGDSSSQFGQSGYGGNNAFESSSSVNRASSSSSFGQGSQGSLNRGSQGTLQGSSQGAFQGSSQGNQQGSSQGAFQGSSQGNQQGSSQGNQQGSSQGNQQGSSQGSFQGSSSQESSQSSYGSNSQGFVGNNGASASGSFGANSGSFGAGSGTFGSGSNSNNRGVIESSSSSFESSRGTTYNSGGSGGKFGTTGFSNTGSSFNSNNPTRFNTNQNTNQNSFQKTNQNTNQNSFQDTNQNRNTNSNGFNNDAVYKQTSESNFVETDTYSSGSDQGAIYRPGAVGSALKPGIPYLPPVDNTNSGSNTISSTASSFSTTRRPITTSRPTYLPPSTSAPGYLPPEQGDSSFNRETIVPGPPKYNDGEIILDETRSTARPQQPPVEVPSGCAAALKCTPIEYCTAEGVISNTTVSLTRDQEAYRVPMTDCKDLETGRQGKCCRDPFYTDPWPTNQLGKWVNGVFGGNDGKYVPDSRGSGNNPRPQVTARPPVTGSVLLNNFRTPKPTTPTFGPNQVTPGYPGTTVSQSSYSSKGQFSQTGQGQIAQGGQGQFAQGGQGQYSQGGRGQFGVAGQGQASQGAQGQFAQGSQFSQSFGQKGQQGQGQTVAQGQGQFGSQGQGQFVTQGQREVVTQGQREVVTQNQGEVIRQGEGQFVQQGQGQFGQGGRGQFGVSAQGQFGQGQGGYTQTQKSFSQTGQTVIQNGEQGQRITGQGQGLGVIGQGQSTTTGQGQGIITGQGQSVSQGVGSGFSQGSGFSVSQGSGFGIENDYSESVQRVFLQQYNGGGQCGLMAGQKPYGNRNDNEVDFAEIPWQAMVLLQTNRSLLCGGVITRPDVVITSAACVDGLEAKNVLIKGGEWKLGIDDEPLPFQIVQVKNILRHPFYKRGSLKYDAAILVLSENLRFANNIYPICLPSASDTLDAFYNGAGECVVTGWGKQVLQAHLAGSIMHSVNVSLLAPSECETQLAQDYPHLREQYDQDSCACGQPTNPISNICRVDIGSALACTTDDRHFVLRGVYSWDSGCTPGNQIAAFYKFDLEWYEWAIGLIESTRFAQFGVAQSQQNRFSGQYKGSQYSSGVKGNSGSSGVKGGYVSKGFGQFGQGQIVSGQRQGISSQGISSQGQLSSGGLGQIVASGLDQLTTAGLGQGQFSSNGQFSQFNSGKYQQGSGFGAQIKAPITNSFSASYTEKKVFQTEPKIITYTTKPEIVTFTTKPEYFTYTTKPKIVTFTTKPQIITYETSGSGTNPQYVAPGVSFNPSFTEVVGKQHTHNAQCKCLQNGKK